MSAGPPPRAQQIGTIVFLLVCLVFILVTRKSCAQQTAQMFRGIDEASPSPGPGGGHSDGERARDLGVPRR